MAFVAALVVTVLVIGANFAQFKTLEQTLGAQVREDARAWAHHIPDLVPDAERLATTGTASTTQLATLTDEINDHGGTGMLFFNGNGILLVSAGRNTWSGHPEWAARMQSLARQVLATGQSRLDVFATGWNEAETVFVGGAFVPILDGFGNAQGVVGVLLDRSVAARTFYDAFVRLSAILSIVFTIALALISSGFILVRRQADQSRQQANYLARHDQLTGLLNRDSFRASVEASKRAGILSCEKAAVLLFDIDNFKAVNDTEGQAVGDAVLRHVGQAISICLGPSDIGARFGGDEFVVICHASCINAADALAERIRTAIARPVDTGKRTIQIRASCGICMGAQCGAGIDEGLQHADLALSQAKFDGRNTSRTFTPELESRVNRRIKIRDAVRNGLRNGLFSLNFQPLIRCDTRLCVGFEALLRLTSADGEKLAPDEFIPVAEAEGLIEHIGQWALGTATAEAANWPEHLYVSVNMSVRQFDKENLVSIVSETLSRTGFDPHRLELEVTESLLMKNSESVGRQLAALRTLGVSIAMDDFGTGYSSLGYLWKYGFDKLKVDRSFVIGLDADAAKGREIIDTIVVLAHRLDMTVTVEGIETELQAELISELACDQMQGFLFGRPMPAADLPAFILGNAARTHAPPTSERHGARCLATGQARHPGRRRTPPARC